MANTIINGGASPYPKHVGPAAIASFSDGADNAPLKSLIFGIEPSQDLHGYANPWPGGGGKNKLPFMAVTSGAVNGVTLTANADGTVTLNGTATANTDYRIYASDTVNDGLTGSYILSGSVGGSSSTYRIVARIRDTSASTNRYVTASNGDASVVTGANEVINNVYITVNNGTALSNKVFYPMLRLSSVSDATFAPYANICPISGWSQVDGKQSGEDMTDYTPITIPLGQTVYGGALDVTSGKLTVTHAFVEYTGASSENWTRDNASRYNIGITGAYKDGYTRIPCYCNMGKFASSGSDVGTVFLSNAFFYYYQPTSITTLADFRTWLASNHLQVAYQLATPIEVDLTPVSVSSVLGQNNIWCNTGDTELDYYPAAASVVAVLNRSSKVYTSIPLGKIRYDTYQTTPNQALDLDSYRAETGVLIRNVLSHTATKIEFNTPSMTNIQWEEVWNIIKAGFNNSTERKLKLKYYDQMSATYKTGWFYVPDVNFTIRNIDEANGIINYDEIRVAFIEY